jgi:hypothetical protein
MGLGRVGGSNGRSAWEEWGGRMERGMGGVGEVLHMAGLSCGGLGLL